MFKIRSRHTQKMSLSDVTLYLNIGWIFEYRWALSGKKWGKSKIVHISHV